MTKLKILFSLPALLLVLSLNGQSLPKGSLVIVGGGLEHTNISIFSQMIDLAGGPEKASFAVIPSASGVAIQSWVLFRKALMSYGVKSGNIHLINIAMADDDSTTDVNESTWSNNGNDPQLAALVRSCSAVWFTGGDQLRTIKTLVKTDGSNTPVLDAVWEVFRAGGVVGGTSAGAAIMSEAMIGGGNSLGALTHGVITDYKGDDFPEGDGLLMAKGLGFFPVGMVDQHFNTRARIGRFCVAMMHEKDRFNLGFGIDENTALIYIGKQKLLKVAGASGVAMINTAGASVSYAQKLPHIQNLKVSYLQDGDSYDFINHKVIPAIGKNPTRGKENYNVQNPGQAGVLSGYTGTFRDLITINLIDNKGTGKVQNISFCNADSGFLVSLTKTAESEGFYTDKPNGDDRYTVTNILMDITPVQLTISPLK